MADDSYKMSSFILSQKLIIFVSVVIIRLSRQKKSLCGVKHFGFLKKNDGPVSKATLGMSRAIYHHCSNLYAVMVDKSS